MKILALIPARMGSSRFPGKPMAKILGKPMIGHVFERVSMCKDLDLTVVATCDQEIFDYVISIGGMAIMTSNKHERASDRCAEALLKIEDKQKTKYDIVVMVQGDEPMTNPAMISEALAPMVKDKAINISNLTAPIKDMNEFNSQNCIKVVCDVDSNALYFSRKPIPWYDSKKIIVPLSLQKQVCIIPFRRDFLIKYINLDPTPLEILESVDMMRCLEHGYKIKMIKTNYETYAVDTKEDLLKVENYIRIENEKII
jgi:3-deoxy-manno-octulosonate cytidylyltransferase (CMP-KDO synthetase)